MTTIKYLIRPVIGVILFIIGLALFILPIPVGWFILGIATIFLAPYVRPMRRLMLWLEKKDPTKSKVLRRFRLWMNRWFPVVEKES